MHAKPIRQRKPKTAVVLIHGMGEQVPMRALRDFVKAVWTTDESLINAHRPDSNTGGLRTENPTWSKPDARNRSFELHRITTETASNGRRTDFYEFYWAHLMNGTTWEHLKMWLFGLLVRSPDRVPRTVRAAWVLLWLVTSVVVGAIVYALLPVDDIRQCAAGHCDPTGCDAAALCWTWVSPVATALLSLGVGWFVNVVLLKYFGDVARYVSAVPLNVARRQEIREKGVELLEILMGIRSAGSDGPNPEPASDYDRIVIVAHSLGAIIAYDILKHHFARVNRSLDLDGMTRQPARDALEQALRSAASEDGALDIDSFQSHQTACLAELMAAGSPWIVSDLVTLGSPLTHAEFLLAENRDDLRSQQTERILPTCPPTLEWDQTTERHHFSYWPSQRRVDDNDEEASLGRIPHHAAHFAYTRWTNIYSPAKAIFWGDIISGPVAEHFGSLDQNGRPLMGIRDIQVLPSADKAGAARRPFIAHTAYWSLSVGAEDGTPHHLRALRSALNLGGNPVDSGTAP